MVGRRREFDVFLSQVPRSQEWKSKRKNIYVESTLESVLALTPGGKAPS